MNHEHVALVVLAIVYGSTLALMWRKAKRAERETRVVRRRLGLRS